MVKSRSMCSGCRENFYHLYGGTCWNFDSAVIEDKIQIPVDMSPPYSFPVKKVLSCYRMSGYVFVRPDVLDEEGYWR